MTATSGRRRYPLAALAAALALAAGAGCAARHGDVPPGARTPRYSFGPLDGAALLRGPLAESPALDPGPVIPGEDLPPPSLTPIDYGGPSRETGARKYRPFYVGIGVELYTTSTTDLDFIDAGFGGDFIFGYILPLGFMARLNQRLSIEMQVQAGFQSAPAFFGFSDVNVIHMRYMLGFKWSFRHRPGEAWRPNISLGGAYHMVTFKNTPDPLDIDGSGGYFGLGLEYYVNEAFSVGADAKGHFWHGNNNLTNYDTITYTVSLTFLYHF